MGAHLSHSTTLLETINRTLGLCYLLTDPFQQSWLLKRLKFCRFCSLKSPGCTVPYMRIQHRNIEGRAFRTMQLNHSAVETWDGLMTKSRWAWIPDFKAPRQRCLEVSRQPIFEREHMHAEQDDVCSHRPRTKLDASDPMIFTHNVCENLHLLRIPNFA